MTCYVRDGARRRRSTKEPSRGPYSWLCAEEVSGPATTDMDNLGVVQALRKKVMIPNMVVQMEINLRTCDLRIKWVRAHSEKEKHAMSPQQRYVALGNTKRGHWQDFEFRTSV